TLGTTPSVNTQTQDIVAVEPQTNAKPSALNILKTPGIASHMLAALALLAILDILVAFMPLVGETVGVSPLVIGSLLAVRGEIGRASCRERGWWAGGAVGGDGK